MEVRPARLSDLGPIVGIYNHYVATSPSTFDVAPIDPPDRVPWMHEHLQGGPHRLLVAVDPSGGVLGWASSSRFRPRPAYSTTVETSVYCRPDSVGVGVGSRLYETLIDELQGHDIERIVAGITLPNPASVALHRRFGFRKVGTFSRVGRKFDRFWDVAWFERPCRPTPSPDGRP